MNVSSVLTRVGLSFSPIIRVTLVTCAVAALCVSYAHCASAAPVGSRHLQRTLKKVCGINHVHNLHIYVAASTSSGHSLNAQTDPTPVIELQPGDPSEPPQPSPPSSCTMPPTQ